MTEFKYFSCFEDTHNFIDYSLSLNKLGNDVDISMYKNQEKDNLLIKDDFKVMGTLFKEQKMEYTYTIKIKANKKVENKKKISISINTINWQKD